MRISDWSSDVCSSDLARPPTRPWRVDPRHRRFDEDRVTIRLDGDTRDRQDPPEDLADALARDLADDLPRIALQDAVADLGAVGRRERPLPAVEHAVAPPRPDRRDRVAQDQQRDTHTKHAEEHRLAGPRHRTQPRCPGPAPPPLHPLT